MLAIHENNIHLNGNLELEMGGSPAACTYIMQDIRGDTLLTGGEGAGLSTY